MKTLNVYLPFILFFLINISWVGCKKENDVFEIKNERSSVEILEAKAVFENFSFSKSSKKLLERSSIDIDLQWDSLRNYNFMDTNADFLCIPTLTKSDGSFKKAIFFKKNSVIDFVVSIVIPDYSYFLKKYGSISKKDFTGKILFFDPKGVFLKGYSFLEGRLDSVMTPKSSLGTRGGGQEYDNLLPELVVTASGPTNSWNPNSYLWFQNLRSGTSSSVIPDRDLQYITNTGGSSGGSSGGNNSDPIIPLNGNNGPGPGVQCSSFIFTSGGGIQQAVTSGSKIVFIGTNGYGSEEVRLGDITITLPSNMSSPKKNSALAMSFAFSMTANRFRNSYMLETDEAVQTYFMGILNGVLGNFGGLSNYGNNTVVANVTPSPTVMYPTYDPRWLWPDCD